MSRTVTVVGSGASGSHLALSLLERGFSVEMFDVGYTGPAPPRAAASFNQLKTSLDDPASYFLGENFEGVVPPDFDKEIYGIPPGKKYVFQHPPGFTHSADGFEPLFSFARGGLAQAWTGGSYPFNDAELREYPFGYDEIGPYYEQVTQRIGIVGVDDDLARYFPVHSDLLPGLELDAHSRLLCERYEAKRAKLVDATGVHLGRSRVAVLSRPLHGRPACDYSGRCLMGCPSGAFYVPAMTLQQCQSHSGFRYRGGRYVTHFSYDHDRRVRGINAVNLADGTREEHDTDLLVLAAGTLVSGAIFIESIRRKTDESVTLHGLMDNRQILMPFITLKLMGGSYDPDSYQYHQLALGLMAEDDDYVHAQLTTLKTAMLQPVLQGMPLDWKTALFVGRHLRSALGVVNLNYSDSRREGNVLTIVPPGDDGALPTPVVRYAPPAGERRKIERSMARFKRFLKGLGAIAPPGQSHWRPMGASVHYCGTLPMTATPRELTLSPGCRSHDFPNLYVVDGSCLPALPAKNLTFTLMANAARVAAGDFGEGVGDGR